MNILLKEHTHNNAINNILKKILIQRSLSCPSEHKEITRIKSKLETGNYFSSCIHVTVNVRYIKR